MPSFKKRTLSLYLRNQCERQFVLHLYNSGERTEYHMPSQTENRSGLTYVGQAGYDWQDEKVSELKDVFGETRVHERRQPNKKRPDKISLVDVLPSVGAYQYIVEGTYAADTQIFRQAIGLNDLTDYDGNKVGIGETRPDVIQVLPSRLESSVPVTEQVPNPYALQVKPNGEMEPIAVNDSRLRLRVIDIKLTSEPGAYYFAEVVYYSMTLAAWLIEKGFDNRFVVVAAPAVWPGRHDASALAGHLAEWKQRAHIPTGQELVQALEEDLEVAVFDIFAPRLRQLLTEELPYVLSKPWHELAWHVDYRCKGCEFLGYPWRDQDNDGENHEKRCWPTAEQEKNLSRVYGLSRGASEQLRHNKITTIDSLAREEASSNVFNQHQGLRTKRTVFPQRAEVLRSGGISIVPNSGGDALMPRWPSLHIYLFLDYDLSSSITAAMAIRAFWREPLPFNSRLEPQSQRWPEAQKEDEIFLVDRRDLERERRGFLSFLQQLAQIIKEVREQDDKDATAGRRDTGRQKNPHERSTYQIYLWDESQRKQFVRMVGRHLPSVLADSSLHELAWLFPPPELLPEVEEATRRSAITLVKPVIENTVALDVPHYYRLLDAAQRVTPPNLSHPFTHPLYQEPLSDLIPMERLHEYWNEGGKGNWLDKQNNIVKATRAKVYALSLTVSWLEKQLQNLLSRQAAPPIIKNQRPVAGLAPVSRLLLGFTKLNAALEELEAHTTRAMPPHEREARLKSARLERRLDGKEKQIALDELNHSNETNLTDGPTLFIYQMRADSCEVNLRRGDFLFALAPEALHGFLDINAYQFTEGTRFVESRFYRQTVEDSQLTAATVTAINRVHGLIALEVPNAGLLRELEQQGRYDFSRNVILDPVHKDYLTKKVEITLKGIGKPSSANNIDVSQALQRRKEGAKTSVESPASEVLWSAVQVQQQPIARDVARVRQSLSTYFTQQSASLNESQWRAWEEALTHRLTLLWGPPGTGKSRTLRAIIFGAILDAYARQQPLRLLITANTYNAIDNVLLDLETELRTLPGGGNYILCRVQSKWRETPPADWMQKYPTLQNLVLNRAKPSQEILKLRQQLENPAGIIIIGCPPEQLHNLAIASQSNSRSKPKDSDKVKDTIRKWFDLILLDEASQMDVATSTLVFSKLAIDGACILAGDDLQLPPIHQAEPPEGLENVVGSVYNFYRHYHAIEPQSLDVNYRSNKTITDFTKMAGYSEALRSFSPDLQLDFSEPIGDARPNNWPDSLYWTSNWRDILDPTYPTVSYVYNDVLSSQVNDFEADTVAALIFLLRGRLKNQLSNERQARGPIRPASETLYEAAQFWNRAIGVVTPHRAQMAKVVSRLRQIFPNDPTEQIYNAVDTVERYQGQERDVIIASFGIGDPDLIRAEDEFLYSLNRFNVLTSRARAKVIVLLTQSLLQHLSNDIQILKESRLLKQYVESYCRDPQQIKLGYIKDGQIQMKDGILRRR